MVDRGRLADEQGVELRDAAVLVRVDDRGVEPQLLRGADEAADRPRVGGRLGLLGIDEDRQVVAVDLGPRAPARPRQVLGRARDHEGAVRLGNLARGDRPHALELPLTAVADEERAQERRRELVEQRGAQTFVPRGQVAAEVDAELEALAAQVAQRGLDQRLDVFRDAAHDRRQPQVLQGRDRGQRAVPARDGEKGHVVADRLVPVRAAQVEDGGAARPGEARIAQVAARRHDLHPWDREGPALLVLEDDDRAHRMVDLLLSLGSGSIRSRFASYVSTPSRIAPMTRSMPTE
jgi:hypothetical protein